MAPFSISHLDHIAIRCEDIEQSALWYEKVLGMQRGNYPEWEPFPIFMLSGSFGVALFPKKGPVTEPPGIRIDHFAFRVSNDDFLSAQTHLKTLGIEFDFQDHHYFHSIYFLDPDGHEVELTTAVL